MRVLAIVLLAGCAETVETACTDVGFCESVYADVGEVEAALMEGAFVELCVDEQCMTKVMEEYEGQRSAYFAELHGSVQSWTTQADSSRAAIVLTLHGNESDVDLPPAQAAITVTVSSFERAVLATRSWVADSETRFHPDTPRCGRCRSVSL